MNATIYVSGKIGKDTTLIDVIRQFKSYDQPDGVEVIVHSEGGSVSEGEAIYNYLKALSAEMTVDTYTDKAYSISAKIFSVGQRRIVEDIDKALMIHFAWANVQGTAERFEIIAEALRELENDFALYYSKFLGVDNETVRSLLDNETFVSGSDAVELGFATEKKMTAKAVAFYTNDKSLKIKKMAKKKNDKGFLSKLMADINAYLNDYDKGVQINAEISLQDSNGTDIVFPNLENGDVPKVGDVATLDGVAITDGSYIMPSLEEKTLVFVDGAITEIIEKEEVKEDEVEIVESEASLEGLIEKVTEKVTGKIKAEFEKKVSLKDNEIKALKKKIGSKEFQAEERDHEETKELVSKTGASMLMTRKKSQ